MKRQKEKSIPLRTNLPQIDLHGEDRKTAELLVKQFLNDLWRQRYERAIIIHGIGSGILKKQVHEILKKDKRIEKYYIDFFNIGCTVVELKKYVAVFETKN